MFTPTEFIAEPKSTLHNDPVASNADDVERIENQDSQMPQEEGGEAAVSPMVSRPGMRRIARRAALQSIFASSYFEDTGAPAQGAAGSEPPKAQPSENLVNLASLSKSLTDFLQHFEIPSRARGFASTLASGVTLHRQEIDLLLTKAAHHWRLDRMSRVDRAILRIAAYELVYSSETPPSVVINEAVELAKDFGGDESPGFINGILDGIRKQLPTAKLA